jgi:hypothetical protein
MTDWVTAGQTMSHGHLLLGLSCSQGRAACLMIFLLLLLTRQDTQPQYPRAQATGCALAGPGGCGHLCAWGRQHMGSDTWRQATTHVAGD